ncbi:MAG TPA: histidinol-phosphate transaminase [Thermoanaerobaculia bacterium]
MLSRRNLIKSSAIALGVASLDLTALAGPVARTSSSWIELDRNENPYGPSPAARKAMIDRIERGNRYLDADELNAFRDKIANFEGVTRDHVVLGAGSSEILWMAAQEYLGEGKTLLQGDPTFELIGRLAEAKGSRVERIAVTPEQEDDFDAIRKAAARASLVYFNWPNNPCGSMAPAAAMKGIAKDLANRCPVFVDEAYLEFVDPSLESSTVSLVKEGANVIVARTFSKIHGLAGMRMGYGVARPEVARRLGSYRFSVLNSLALAASSAALDDQEFIASSHRRIKEGKTAIYRLFDDLGVRYIPSSASFVWFHEGDRNWAPRLRERQILIPSGRFSGGWNRVTVGTAEEIARFGEAVRSLA